MLSNQAFLSVTQSVGKLKNASEEKLKRYKVKYSVAVLSDGVYIAY